MTWWILLTAGWILAICWITNGFLLIRFLGKKRLDNCSGVFPNPDDWPSLSVIVAARDESQSIESTLHSLAVMDYPKLEIIAVDDRSMDGTGEIMDRVAAEKTMVRVVHIHELPEGWLGKCHALHRGAQLASGELLLFTDGDVHFTADALRLAVRYFVSTKIDHLVLCPGMTAEGYWEEAVKSFFAMAFIMSMRAWAVSKPLKNVYIGAGAFNLVRRTAYDNIGGHASIKLEILDDIMLGKRIKQKGHRQDILLAPQHLKLYWLRGVKGFVKGLEKNAFAAVRFSVPRLLFATLLMLILFIIPYLGILAFQDARVSGYIATVLAMHAAFGVCASAYRCGWRLAPALPVTAFIYIWTLWRSALISIRRGGVLWRNTFYSLKELK